MSPYDAYEQARKEYAHLPQRMRLRRDLIASRALQFLGVMGKESISLMITYSGGKTRDRVVAAYEHHLNRTMNKTKERQAMKYAACSTCKNEPYQAGVGGPCATCSNDDPEGPTSWYPKISAELAKAQASIERRADDLRKNPPIQKVLDAMATQVGGSHYKDMPIQPVEFITKNGIGFVEGSVIEYVSRWRKKGGVDDLRKARHFLDMLIEMEGRA